MDEWEFTGKKLQFLFDPPEDMDFPACLFDPIADVTGIDRGEMTLCERHIKAYEPVADPAPPAHKDRIASQISVGLPLRVPEGSHVVLYADDELDTNAVGTTAQFRESLDEEELPENKLQGLTPVAVYDEPGDVLMFRGHSIWHERNNAANAILLYFKLNSMRLDPVGEDPSTLTQRERSLALLESTEDDALSNLFVEVSPRLDRISRHYTRWNWQEVVQGHVWGESSFGLSESEVKILRGIRGRVKVAALLDKLQAGNGGQAEHFNMLRRLCKLQAIDFLESSDR